jgi:ATP-binding cassette, subfamily B, bacterial
MITNLRHIVEYFRPYWAIALFSITATGLFEIAELIVPYSVGQIVGLLSGQALDARLQTLIRTISPDASFDLPILIGLVFLVTVGKAPIQPWVGTWFHWDIALRAKRDQMGNAIAKLLSLPLEFYDENNPGRIAGLISRGLSNYTWTYPDVAGQWIPKLSRVLGIFVVLWLIQWQIAILFLGSFGLTLGLGFNKLKQIMQREKGLEDYIEDTESRTSEIITNIKTIKAFATETAELKRQKRRLKREFLKADYRIHKGYVVLFMQQQIVIYTSQFLMLSLTLWATVQGHMTLGHFITILTATNIAYADLEPLNALAEQFARRFVSMVRFNEFMQLPNSAESLSLYDHADVVKHYQFSGKVEFSDVSFSYESSESQEILQTINLVIQPCQTIAFIGRSGAGKSTLVKLLLRYFEPTSGQILMDGQDIRLLDIVGYRKRLAIVHQEVDLFNGTVWENLTYGYSDATASEVHEACQISRVDEFVTRFPQGYGTIVGERGMRLSGGQRQRLGIARALIANPDILIFDEATSSLDSESERAIQLAMQSILGTRTTIIIAHRLSTVRDADQIVVVDSGRIVEIGNHEALSTSGGLYQRLHTIQTSGKWR